MSKKKGKPAAKKGSKKAAPKKAAPRKAAATARSTARLAGADANGRTVSATIFIYRTGSGNKIRTSPQRLCANPGDRIEWSVVNLVDGSEVPVTITWPGGGPWGKEPLAFRGSDRRAVNGGTQGRFKYVVSALDAQEDPEVEIPDVEMSYRRSGRSTRPARAVVNVPLRRASSPLTMMSSNPCESWCGLS
jgi:hypothetical protein